ncbi:YlxR family protein [Brevibacterium sp. BRM-1]|uniref:YlxR family protein n=1 Tax=Brevibacterium sp. BRM-1 TaxID=2999062 RepID=UPI002282BCA4|nr:YlxR family protein [Brevibacterium sp. BRM-1]WAL41251.1 YlxR family protein [Brevibacterium sp. BRM-1]
MVCADTPERMCIGCRGRAPAGQLLRLVSQPGSPPHVRVDPDRSLPGRGASIHRAEQCWSAALKKNAFARALRSPGIRVPDWASIDHGKWLSEMDTQQ